MTSVRLPSIFLMAFSKLVHSTFAGDGVAASSPSGCFFTCVAHFEIAITDLKKARLTRNPCGTKNLANLEFEWSSNHTLPYGLHWFLCWLPKLGSMYQAGSDTLILLVRLAWALIISHHILYQYQCMNPTLQKYQCISLGRIHWDFCWFFILRSMYPIGTRIITKTF